MPDEQNTNEEQVLYPGRLAEYHKAKNLREKQQENDGEIVTTQFVGLMIAEQLAGLNYILDGIRYSARNK